MMYLTPLQERKVVQRDSGRFDKRVPPRTWLQYGSVCQNVRAEQGIYIHSGTKRKPGKQQTRYSIA